MSTTMITNKRVREDNTVEEVIQCKRTCPDVADGTTTEPLYRLPLILRHHEADLMDQYDCYFDNFVEELTMPYNKANIEELSNVDDSGRCLECYKRFIGEDKLAYTNDNIINECKRLKLTKVETAFVNAVLALLYDDTNEIPQSELEQMVDEDEDGEFTNAGVYPHHVEVIMDMMLFYQCVKWARDVDEVEGESESEDEDDSDHEDESDSEDED